MRETWVRSLGWEDPLEKGKAATPGFWPGASHGLYGLWGRKELDTTERLSLIHSQPINNVVIVSAKGLGPMYVYILEKAMAPHSNTLAWQIPWTEEPGGLLSIGLHRVGHH